MLKRVCDKCGAEIKEDGHWYRMGVERMRMEGSIYCGAGTYDFCEGCFFTFKQNLANKT